MSSLGNNKNTVNLKKPLTNNGWNSVSGYDPSKLQIVTTNLSGRCTFECPYCHSDSGEAEKDELKLDSILRIIDQASDLGAKVLWIAGKGEPTIDPNFKEVVKEANNHKLVTIVSTNAAAIDKNMAKFMYLNNVSPEVKIPTFDREIYNLLAGKPADSNTYDKFINGLDALKEAGYGKIIDETNRVTRMSAMILLAKPSYSGLEEVFKYCNDNNITPSVNQVIPAGRILKNRTYDKFFVSEEDNKRLFSKASAIMGYVLPEEDCQIKKGIFIDSNGDILTDNHGNSCDIQIEGETHLIGNVNNMSLEEAWSIILDKRENAPKCLYEPHHEPGIFSICQKGLCAIENYKSISHKS